MSETPEQKVDQFLAAPEQVRQNAVEMQKARLRKAQEAARVAQELAGKSQAPPTIEDMLADLIRVADDPETNPFWKFRTLSRKRYQLYGHFPVAHVDREFGQFEHAKQVAGLSEQPGTRLWRARRAAQSRAEHAERYMERHVRPYVQRARDLRIVGDSYLLLSINDTHSQMLCPFVWSAFLQFRDALQPDGLLFNGDTMDCPQVSRHPKIPGWTPDLQSELDFQDEMFRQAREGYAGDIFSTGGNHDLVDRLARHLTQVDPYLTSLRCLRVDELMGLERHRVRLFHGGTIMSPAGEEDAKTGFLMFGKYRVHHGDRLGRRAAQEELKASGRSGQSGHRHVADMAYGTSELTEGQSWMCVPMGARQEVGRSYMRGVSTGWQRGIGLARIFPDGSAHQYPVVVSGTPERMTCEGMTVMRPDWMADPKPEGVWLRDMPKIQVM